MSEKTNKGRFFEDFHVGQELIHATPRSLSGGERALMVAIYGPRFAVQSSLAFAQSIGLHQAPMDDFLVFNIVFGKTVPDISLNAIANLGYAGGRYGVPVLPYDTVKARSTVIGLRPSKNRETGVVYVRSIGTNQHNQMVLDYVRWVLVRARDPGSPAPETVVPDLPGAVPVEDLTVPPGLDLTNLDLDKTGSPYLWEDYEVGEQIDHVDGMTIEEADHMAATRLYQNTAKVHFNQFSEKDGRFGRRIVYGGHIITMARALSFNGLANAIKVAAINAGTHSNPSFAGDTIFAWSEVLDKMELPWRKDIGALRLRTVATKDLPCEAFPYKDADGKYLPNVVLDFDYTILMPRRR